MSQPTAVTVSRAESTELAGLPLCDRRCQGSTCGMFADFTVADVNVCDAHVAAELHNVLPDRT